jgi:hypothetical protein
MGESTFDVKWCVKPARSRMAERKGFEPLIRL